MDQTNVAFDISMLEYKQYAALRGLKSHTPQTVGLLTAEIPKVLLIDEDRSFVENFANLALRYRVPFQSFRSQAGLETRRTWDYDLVLLDDKTIGRDNLVQTASRMMDLRGDLSIIVIGSEEPTRQEKKEWEPFIQSFLYKDWAAGSLFNDVLQIYSSGRPRLFGRRPRLFGGSYGMD